MLATIPLAPPAVKVAINAPYVPSKPTPGAPDIGVKGLVPSPPVVA